MAQNWSIGGVKPDILNSHYGKQAVEYLHLKGYKFIRELGGGAFGEVWEVFAIPHQCNVACKAMKMSPFTLGISAQRCLSIMLYESDVMKDLDHPNVIKMENVLHITFPGDVYAFIFMEMCEKDLLGYYMGTPLGHLFPEQAHEWFKQIVSGLKYLHDKQISHLDIKPPNILLKNDQNGKNVFKLTDFGLSKAFKTDEPDVGTEMCGTPFYQPPEVNNLTNAFFSIFAPGTLNYETKPFDIYSLGVTLFETMTGQTNLRMQSLDIFLRMSGTDRTMHENMVKLIRDMTSADPKSRPTINEVANNVWVRTGYVR